MKVETITITGRPCSKKNSRRVFRSRDGSNRMIFAPSAAYDRFHEDALGQLRHAGRFTGPVRIDYMFYIKGKYSQDIDNAMASINDVLQDAQVIVDDDLNERGSYQKIRESDDWKTIVRISETRQQRA